jgi:hypothetical protein
MRAAGRALVLLAAAAAAVPAARAVAAPADSGVAGDVRSTAGRGLPLDARLVVRDAVTGHTVARAHTVRMGRFRIRLAPGRYALHATVPGSRAVANRTVTVRAHRFTRVALRVGLRPRPAAPAPY